MESRFPVRLDKRAVEEESYMCRGVEAITPKGNGVEDEEERSGETDSSCFHIRSGGWLLACERREGRAVVGKGVGGSEAGAQIYIGNAPVLALV